MILILVFLPPPIVFAFAHAPPCANPTTEQIEYTTTTPALTEEGCPVYQIRVECPGCRRTCDSLLNPPHACPFFCVFGGVCVCDEEFYENDDGDCVPAYECPGYVVTIPDTNPIPYPVPRPPPE